LDSVGRRDGMRGGVLAENEAFLVSAMSDTPNFLLNTEHGTSYKGKTK